MTTESNRRTEEGWTEEGQWTQRLRYIGGALAFAIAALHALHPDWGIRGLVVYANVGALPDPRPLFFVVSGIVIIGGVLAVLLGAPRKSIYLGGMILMVLYIVGYFGWHMVGHGAWWPWGGEGFASDSLYAIIFGPNHLRGSLDELISKLLELALLIVLGLLYYRE